MMKRILTVALALALLGGGALAEVYAGSTVAGSTLAVSAPDGGTLTEVLAQPGARVEAGQALAELRTRKVYAAEDGTVARILAREGAQVDGAVLELAPVSRYTIHCTVDGAASSAESTFVHAGEALYLRCTANGTHRGTGVVTQIDGETYLVAATGGELYVGETVRLYRDADFTSSQRVGIGTVVAADPQSYEAQGYLLRLHVAEGEFVERGELLYECAESAQTELTAPAAGIVTEAAASGDALQAGQAALTLAPLDAIQVEFLVDEEAAAALAPDDSVALIRADDPREAERRGAILSVSGAAEGGLYAVRVQAEEPLDRLGLTVYVRTQD